MSKNSDDGPMPLFSTETEEQLRAQLAERDARIAELNHQVYLGDKRLSEQRALRAAVTRERDAALAKFREFREAVAEAVDDSREHGATGSVWSSHLEELLDRFPADEPSDPAQKGGE